MIIISLGVIYVQGEDFDIGEGITKEVENRVSEVVTEIVKFLDSGIWGHRDFHFK